MSADLLTFPLNEGTIDTSIKLGASDEHPRYRTINRLSALVFKIFPFLSGLSLVLIGLKIIS